MLLQLLVLLLVLFVLLLQYSEEVTLVCCILHANCG